MVILSTDSSIALHYMEVKTNNFTCIYARGFFRICDEQSGTFWIQDSFCLYTKMGECEIKMSRFGRVSGAFEPNNNKKKKTSANPNTLKQLSGISLLRRGSMRRYGLPCSQYIDSARAKSEAVVRLISIVYLNNGRTNAYGQFSQNQNFLDAKITKLC